MESSICNSTGEGQIPGPLEAKYKQGSLPPLPHLKVLSVPVIDDSRSSLLSLTRVGTNLFLNTAILEQYVI
ncbi:hypothetical protein [Methanolobus sp.]|uniref:hypothetical protein n=1 Tax=Methanolobus sp. TaxID=1874737 RepID=UPI0025EDEF53|nr:hypothetical protein [Methanolobus sp.]